MRDKAQYGALRRIAAMTVFGASHFTALLAAIAIVGTAGSFWWAMEIRADLKSGAGNRSADRAFPSKPPSHSLRAKDERSNKFASSGRSERPQPSPPGRGADRDPLPERAAPAPSVVSVNYASPGLQDKGADMPL